MLRSHRGWRPYRPLQWLLCAALLTCTTGCPDDGEGDGGGAGAWHTVTDGAGGAFPCIWGTADDVWVVGGDAGTGSGPAAFRMADGRWAPLPTEGTRGALWWVFGVAADTVFMVGDHGTILRHDPTGGSTVAEASGLPGEATLYGVWGTGPDDVWTVGDDGALGVILHRDAAGWSPSEGVSLDVLEGVILYKVWGTGPDDVWVVGSGGTVLHKDAAGWSMVPVPAGDAERAPLFTVHSGDDGRAVIVGGARAGVILEWDGQHLLDLTPSGANPLWGVRVGPSAGGDALAVGQGGAIYWRRDGAWVSDESWPTDWDLHGAWIDPHGGAWAVGGDLFNERPLAGDGVVLHYGPEAPPPLLR